MTDQDNTALRARVDELERVLRNIHEREGDPCACGEAGECADECIIACALSRTPAASLARQQARDRVIEAAKVVARKLKWDGMESNARDDPGEAEQEIDALIAAVAAAQEWGAV